MTKDDQILKLNEKLIELQKKQVKVKEKDALNTKIRMLKRSIADVKNAKFIRAKKNLGTGLRKFGAGVRQTAVNAQALRNQLTKSNTQAKKKSGVKKSSFDPHAASKRLQDVLGNL